MSVRRRFAVLLTSLLSWQTAYADAITNHELIRPEGARRFYVMQPDGLPASLRPVVILLHGHGASAAWMLGRDSFGGYRSQDWVRLAASRKVMLIAPDGIKADNGK